MTRRDVLQAAGFAFCAQDLIKAAQEPSIQTMPGTQLLSWQGDLSERMMDGAHKYVERKIANAPLIGKDSPESRPVQPPELGRIVAIPQVGGLHHRYERRAA